MESEDKVTVTVSADGIFRLMREIKNLKAVNVELRKDIDEKQKAQDCLRAEFAAYRLGEAEREANIRRQNEREYQRRCKLFELNERKAKAYQDYHNSYGTALNAIKAILEGRITKADRAAIEDEQERINAAWKKFDAVQNEVNEQLRIVGWDPCKSKMPPPSVKEGAKE